MRLCVKVFLLFFVILSGGCGNVCDLSSFGCLPKVRIGCVPGPSFWTRFPEPDALGRHSYGYSFSERNGIVYTCRGGHIDLVHLRGSADWTVYLAGRAYDCILDVEPEFRFKIIEPSVYTVGFEYPSGWGELSAEERREIASAAAVDIGQYLCYVAGVWHEIVTWYGYKSAGVYSERRSAFSWEDIYSNVVGVSIAGEALRDFRGEGFAETMTSLIEEELALLCVQPGVVAREAAESVRDRGEFVYGDMPGRNFDIGLDDGFVSPVIVAAESGCESHSPTAWPVPSGDLSKYGIKVTVRIRPREWERGEILKAAYRGEGQQGEYIEPEVHFANIISEIAGREI